MGFKHCHEIAITGNGKFIPPICFFWWWLGDGLWNCFTMFYQHYLIFRFKIWSLMILNIFWGEIYQQLYENTPVMRRCVLSWFWMVENGGKKGKCPFLGHPANMILNPSQSLPWGVPYGSLWATGITIAKWWFPKIGVPPNHPFLDGIFHDTPIYGNPHINN